MTKWAKEDIKGATDGIKKCETIVKSYCSQVRQLNGGDFALDYATKGCDVRSITKSDVEKDAQDFKRLGMTEAEVQDHIALGDIIEFCENANANEFYWPYTAPAVNKSQCSKSSSYETPKRPSGCCKICTKGQACGNSCISWSKTCRVGVGCACQG